MISIYEHKFLGETHKKQSSPILKEDHLKLGGLEFVFEEEKAKYISMIRTAQ